MLIDPLDAFAVSLPVAAMSLVVIVLICSRLKQLFTKEKHPHLKRLFVTGAALGSVFLPFFAIYRPSLAEQIKAEIRQQEDADEDDNGDPESPTKHLLRQLRRIRRGEKVDTLFFRLK